ncbi:MAG: membrane protein insertion efficiency factor YidD [Phycisphaeraceae bacterium]|nr:membrane protein insertion efficiency factor YidD [Phycisphaeraceae bacterium]
MALVSLYQRLLSPVLGGRCRFHPSCSCYAKEALRTHGAIRGSALTLRRLARCHPWGGSGVDPVPPLGGGSKENLGVLRHAPGPVRADHDHQVASAADRVL